MNVPAVATEADNAQWRAGQTNRNISTNYGTDETEDASGLRRASILDRVAAVLLAGLALARSKTKSIRGDNVHKMEIRTR